MLEQTFALVRYNSVFVPLCSPNTCKRVFNPNVTTFQSNCAEGLQLVLFISFCFVTYCCLLCPIVRASSIFCLEGDGQNLNSIQTSMASVF